MARFTVRRLMVGVIFAAALLAPAGWAARVPDSGPTQGAGWMLAAAWAGRLPLARWAYRNYRNPFG